MKILIIQKKFMGDVLVTSTILPLLKKKYPDAEISILLEQKHAQILIGNPYVNNVIFFKDSIFETLAEIKHQNFDLVIDGYSKIETGIISLLSGAKTRIGFFKKYNQFFYNFPIKRKENAISKNTTLGIEHRMQLLEPLNIPFEETFPKTYILGEELRNARKILSENGLSENDKLIMISTFGSSAEKTYPIKYMAKVLDYIVDFQPDSKILCNYLPLQKELFSEIYQLVSTKTQKAIVKDFDTKSLREFAAVTSLCKCLIGNEGGATNVSKSLKIPTVTLFSPHIQLKDWAWSSLPDLDLFLHVNDFVAKSKNYADFKPDYFKNQLREFLGKVM